MRFCLDIPVSSELGKGEEDPDYNCTNITIIQDNKKIVCTAKREFTIQGLDDGREYIFNVSSCLNHLGSEGSHEFPGMTSKLLNSSTLKQYKIPETISVYLCIYHYLKFYVTV